MKKAAFIVAVLAGMLLFGRYAFSGNIQPEAGIIHFKKVVKCQKEKHRITVVEGSHKYHSYETMVILDKTILLSVIGEPYVDATYVEGDDNCQGVFYLITERFEEGGSRYVLHSFIFEDGVMQIWNSETIPMALSGQNAEFHFSGNLMIGTLEYGDEYYVGVYNLKNGLDLDIKPFNIFHPPKP